MAQNDRESAQILLRHSEEVAISGVEFSALTDGVENTIAAENIKYNFVDYHRINTNSGGQTADSTIRWGADDYPDRLSNDTGRTVAAGKTQSIWVTVHAPTGTTAGTYTGTATVNTDKGDIPVSITAEVVDVEIPSADEAVFDLAYWQNISGTWNWSGINPDRYIITGIFPEIKAEGKWGEKWWNYVESAADVMEEARINVLHVQPLELLMDGGSTVTGYDEEGNAEYAFNWSKFDAYIQYFLDRGFIKKLELYHLLNTKYSVQTEPTILIPNPDYDALAGFSFTNRPLKIEEGGNYFAPADGEKMAPRVEAFYDQYITALDAHLKEKGWIDMAYQHVEDEAISTREKKEYKHMAEFFAARTDIPFGDPVDQGGSIDFMLETTPLQFPLSNLFDSRKASYQERIAEQPGSVMMYTCLNPQGNNLNKFIDKPVWQMRVQTWYSYAVDVTGHLHWAWDAGWSDASKADATGVDVIKDINAFIYKGDDFVVWPDVERGGVASSIRAASIRDGAEDYEVFNLLAQQNADYGTWVKQQIGGIVRSNSDYEKDIETIMATRERIYRVAGGEIDIYSTVNFDGNGGTVAAATVKIVTGAALGAKMPADPTRAGYLFTGWNTAQDGSGKVFTSETVVNEAVTVYAQWISGNDILSFSVNGISSAIDAEDRTVTVELSHGTDLTALAPAVTVSAGASCSPASGTATDFTGPVTYTVTAGDGTAQTWTVTITAAAGADQNRTVTFEENGGEPALTDLIVPNGAKLAEPVHSMTITNKTFVGWYKDEELTEAWDFASDTVTEDHTLYAKWVDEFYYNDFDDPDNKGNWKTRTGAAITEKGIIIDDPEAVDGKAIYFDSMLQTTEYGRAVVCSDAGQMVNGTLEMRVKVNATGESSAPTLGLSFRSPAKDGVYNGISMMGGKHANRLLADTSGGWAAGDTWSDPWTDAVQEIKEDQYYTIQLRFYDQAMTLTVDGKQIVSGDTSWPKWSSDPGCVGLYVWGTETSYTIDYIKVTQARTPAAYSVRFDTQGGGDIPPIESIEEGAAIAIKPADPIRAGHRFLGWHRDAQGKSAWDFSSDKVYANITLYAKWEALSGAKEITSFVVNGYEEYPAVIDAAAHTISVTLPAGTELYLTPTIGLSEDASVVPASGLAVTFDNGAPKAYTVTAQDGTTQAWAVTVTVMTAGSHRVTWHANGGSPVPGQTFVEAGGTIAAPAAMARSGYTFDGWYLDEGFTARAEFPVANVIKDMDLYAKWTAGAQATYVFMSDPHITGAGDGNRLNYAFKYVDKLLPNGYDGLILAGDLVSDGAGDSQMKHVQQILDGYQTGPEGKYVIRGNHDPVSAMNTLNDEYYPSSYYHVEMGGYHFLMCDTNDFGTTQQSWLSDELSKIENGSGYDAGEPIFVVMHAPLSGTVLGNSGNSFGSSSAVYGILEDYPQAVVLSGHSHRDIYDDRSIHQKDFTSVHLGGMQYIELDDGRIEGNVPAQTGLVHEDGSQSQMNQAVVATVYADRIMFDRYDFSVDKHLGTWEVALPLVKDSFTHTESDRDKEAPAFTEDDAISFNMTSSSEVEFAYPQATDNAFVYDYKIDLKKGGETVKSILTFSQFYAAEMPEIKTNQFDGLTPETAYTLEITARDSVGNASVKKLTADFTTTAEGIMGSISCEDPAFNLGRPKDVAVNVTSQDVDLHSLRFGNVALTPGKDYTLDGDRAVISKDYLAQFGAGATVVLDFVFEKGDRAELALQVTSDKHTVTTFTRDFENGSTDGLETYRQDYTIAINTESPLGGEKSLQITTGNNGKQMLLDTNVPKVSDGILEFDVKPTGADLGAMAFSIRGTDDNNQLAIGCDGVGDWLWINTAGGAETYALLANDSVPLLAGETYHIKISFYGDNYEVYVDDTCVIRTVVPGLTRQAGYVGIHNWGSSTRGVIIDDLKLTYAVEKEIPSTPPSGGGSSSNTTTRTEKNQDGSTTKTVTNKKTGEVVATTTYPDGTQIVAVTPKDGKTSIEVTVPKDKDSVTVTIPTAEKPKSGEVAVIVHEDGTREVVRTSVSTGDGLRVTLTGNAKLEIADNSKRFADVGESHWAHGAVQFAASRELFNGTGNNFFSPAADMTRAMFFTVLHRLSGAETGEAGETWYSNAMSWAVEQGVSDGTAPGASITREQLVVMLCRYAKAEKLDADLKDFSDAASVSPWAAEAMNWAVKSGIITGKNGTLDPQGNASRAEVAAMLERFVSQLAK